MIKCPLCGWNNHESTQHCISCGGDLENRKGLVVEDDNPNCYSFTPSRRIINKGVGLSGSGNDLIYKFSGSRLMIWLIVVKTLLFAMFPYITFLLYREDNSLFYVFIPLTILYAIEIIGWILFSYGGRKKRRKHIGLGLRFLYAFYAIGMAYCILTFLIAVYLLIAIGLSWNLGSSLNGMIDGAPSQGAVSFMIAAIIVLLIFIVFLNVCAKFFHYAHEIFVKNSLKYYRFTGLIRIVFVIIAVISSLCTVLVACKEYTLELISRYELLKTYLYTFVSEYSSLAAACFGLFGVIAFISVFMVSDYIKSYKGMFVSA